VVLGDLELDAFFRVVGVDRDAYDVLGLVVA
jgi:hypothetical protein